MAAIRQRQRSEHRESLFVILWRHRHRLAPLYVAFATWAAGMIAFHWLSPITTALICLFLTAVFAIWSGQVLDRKIERAYARTVAGFAAAWAVAASMLGADHPVLLRVLAVGGLLCAIPWWLHRRVRAQVRVERTIAAWPRVAETAGLARSRLTGVLVTTWGWTGRLRLAAGQTARDVTGRLRTVESALQLPVGSVRAEPWPDRADVAVMRVIESDPHSDPVYWAGSPAASIADPMPVGPYDDGDVCRVPLYDRQSGTHHALIAGTNGSGKSGLLNLMACHAVTAPDAVLWAIDLKGGIELRPWWPVTDWLSTTAESARTMLGALREVIDVRGRHATNRVWQASPEQPVIVVLIDEAAELPVECVPDLESVARRGRALGVALVLATQYPTVNAVGSAQVRAQLRTRVAFRFLKTGEASTVLRDTAGTDPAVIRKDRPGCGYVEAAGAERPALVRCYWVTDDLVSEVVETWRGRQPALDPATADVVSTFPADADDERDAPPNIPAARQTDSAAEEPAAPLAALAERGPATRSPAKKRLDNEQARTALRAALSGAGEEGTTVEALGAECDRRKTWIYRELDALETARLAERTGRHGYYRGTPRLRNEPAE
ncbi:FtsK/SpoIIIE family protein [Actinoalloteichus sp. GBA129-24]|nr:FtsK/SpoIIIE family protein [Actinoalloteichus sp. GBA129-24]